MTIPNCISLFRIFLVPCFAWVFLTASLPEDFTLAAVLLVVSAVSDLLDGWIARRFHMTSKLGKILDPAADKLTLFGVCLHVGPVSGILAAVQPVHCQGTADGCRQCADPAPQS